MTIVPEIEFKEMLEKEDFNLPKRYILHDSDDYKGQYPLVLKVSSEKVTHKTEAGAVVTDIKTPEDLEQAFSAMRNRFQGEAIYGEEMAAKGVEVIVGLIKDPAFGKLLLFGVGGFYSELIRDVSFKKIPIDRYDAEDILEELKFSRLFDGYRGMKVNKEVIVDLLLKISDFSIRNDFSQIDFNPVFLYEDSYVIIDSKLVV